MTETETDAKLQGKVLRYLRAVEKTLDVVTNPRAKAAAIIWAKVLLQKEAQWLREDLLAAGWTDAGDADEQPARPA